MFDKRFFTRIKTNFIIISNFCFFRCYLHGIVKSSEHTRNIVAHMNPLGVLCARDVMGPATGLAEAMIDADAGDGEGVTMTNVELTAAQTATRALEQEEPLPQTIYKVRISSDMPLLVPFRMIATAP